MRLRRPATATLHPLPGEHSCVEPPDPIPNSEVKRARADGSVHPHARVGHRQGLTPNPDPKGRGFSLPESTPPTPYATDKTGNSNRRHPPTSHPRTEGASSTPTRSQTTAKRRSTRRPPIDRNQHGLVSPERTESRASACINGECAAFQPPAPLRQLPGAC